MAEQLVTIHVNSEQVRLSRVSAHGEEIIADPEPEIACLASFIYKHLAEGGSLTGVDIQASILEASRSLDASRKALAQPLQAMDAMVGILQAMSRRIDALEHMLVNRVITNDSLKQWLSDFIVNRVIKQEDTIFNPPKGQ